MRISINQYAQSLYEVTKDKSQGEIGGMLANFVKILSKNNQLKLKNSVIKKFGEIYNQKKGIVEAQVTSREKLSDDVRTEVSTKVSIKYGAKKVVLVERVDKDIKGGIIIRVGDDILDGSIKRKLEELKNNLSK